MGGTHGQTGARTDWFFLEGGWGAAATTPVISAVGLSTDRSAASARLSWGGRRSAGRPGAPAADRRASAVSGWRTALLQQGRRASGMGVVDPRHSIGYCTYLDILRTLRIRMRTLISGGEEEKNRRMKIAYIQY